MALWLLWMMLPWTWVYKYLSGAPCALPLLLPCGGHVLSKPVCLHAGFPVWSVNKSVLGISHVFDGWLGTVGRVTYKLEVLTVGNFCLPEVHTQWAWCDMTLARLWSELKQGYKAAWGLDGGAPCWGKHSTVVSDMLSCFAAQHSLYSPQLKETCFNFLKTDPKCYFENWGALCLP